MEQGHKGEKSAGKMSAVKVDMLSPLQLTGFLLPVFLSLCWAWGIIQGPDSEL